MVARSKPVGIRQPPKPTPEEAKRKELQDAVQRHTNGLAKAIAALAVLEAKRELAA